LEEAGIGEDVIKMVHMEIGPADMDGIRVVKDRTLLFYLVTIVLKLRVH
jgi:hypothetical protein